MKYLPENISYPDSERPKLRLLDKLFREWHEHFATSESGKEIATDMVFDGFYPYYFNQKKRILFIGREALDITGNNYIDLLYQHYRGDKLIGKQPINKDKFHSRMFYFAYGITNGMLEWNNISYASEICDIFGMEGGLSFAFMNISKISNQGEHWSANWNLINTAFTLSTRDRNFIQEEIAILEPQIIVTMCLGEKIRSFGQVEPIYDSAQANSYWLTIQGHRSLLIDTWHFSARKKALTDYYIPICDAIRRSEMMTVEQN